MQSTHTPEPPTVTPLISFIVAYYNLPVDMLRQCINSILALPLAPHEREVIVVDDGSDVAPPPQLADLAPHISIITLENGGLSRARNTGIDMANGRYIQFVDADDMLLVDTYAHCLDVVRSESPDMVLFNLTRSPHTTAAPTLLPTMSGTDFMLSHNIHGSACAYLFRRDMLGTLRFTPDILHEDEEFTPRLLLQAATVRCSSASAYLYRSRPGSITTATNLRQQLRRLSDARHIIGRLNSLAATLCGDQQRALLRRVHQLTMDYLYNIMTNTRSRSYLNRQIDSLRREALYPLPPHNYTRKYQWFSRLANSPTGLRLLFSALVLKSKSKCL